jgi:hypothetical protein
MADGPKNLHTSPRYKIHQTILYLLVEIKTFSLLWANFFMFFPSRIDASHAGVIGHAVYRQHVGRRSRVDRMRVGITA